MQDSKAKKQIEEVEPDQENNTADRPGLRLFDRMLLFCYLYHLFLWVISPSSAVPVDTCSSASQLDYSAPLSYKETHHTAGGIDFCLSLPTISCP